MSEITATNVTQKCIMNIDGSDKKQIETFAHNRWLLIQELGCNEKNRVTKTRPLGRSQPKLQMQQTTDQTTHVMTLFTGQPSQVTGILGAHMSAEDVEALADYGATGAGQKGANEGDRGRSIQWKTGTHILVTPTDSCAVHHLISDPHC